MPKYLIAEEGPLKGLLFTLNDLQSEYLIGRDPELVDFVLDDASVSRKHVLISKTDDGFCITDLSHTNPTEINGSEIIENTLLHEHDKIKIGHNLFLYTDELPEEFLLEQPLPSHTENPPPFYEQPLENTTESENFQAIKEEAEETPEETEAYNTIFEEETPEEVPYNLMADDSIILKVTSGPNTGAEFVMDKNHRYILGKDTDACDIVFNDLSVSKEHAEISIDSEGIVFIEDLNSTNGTIVNSQKIENKAEISSKDTIFLGTTSFIIIDPKDATATLYTPLPEESTEDIMSKEPLSSEAFLKEEDAAISEWKKQIIPKNHLVIAGSIAVSLFMLQLAP